MKINLINNNRINRNLNFASTSRTIYSFQKNNVVLDEFIKGKSGLVNSNYTTFFRTDSGNPFFDQNWIHFAQKLERSLPKDKKINVYDFACSDGSEAYSLIISLLEGIGEEKAERYFPIKAYDIDEEIIRRANSGYIEARRDDIDKINKFTGNKLEKYFSIEYKTKTEDKFILKAKPILTDKVIFEQKNLKDMAKQLNEPYSLIFTRNMWKYLKSDDAVQIIGDLRENMDKSSRLFIGTFDFCYLDIDTGKIPYFFELGGFEWTPSAGCALVKSDKYDKEKAEKNNCIKAVFQWLKASY